MPKERVILGILSGDSAGPRGVDQGTVEKRGFCTGLKGKAFLLLSLFCFEVFISVEFVFCFVFSRKKQWDRSQKLDLSWCSGSAVCELEPGTEVLGFEGRGTAGTAPAHQGARWAACLFPHLYPTFWSPESHHPRWHAHPCWGLSTSSHI